jgi:hypothetical protein
MQKVTLEEARRMSPEELVNAGRFALRALAEEVGVFRDSTSKARFMGQRNIDMAKQLCSTIQLRDLLDKEIFHFMRRLRSATDRKISLGLLTDLVMWRLKESEVRHRLYTQLMMSSPKLEPTWHDRFRDSLQVLRKRGLKGNLTALLSESSKLWKKP